MSALQTKGPSVFVLALITLVTAGSLGAAPVQTLNVAINGSPDTLDPHKTSGTITFQIVKSVYDTLVEPDKTGKIVPALAESWDISADGLSWTFKLRKNVVFHNGDKLSSADVKASLERIRDKTVGSPSGSELAVVKDILTPDATTVKITLSQPSAPLLSSLASGWFAILPKSLIDKNWDFGTKPVGTGPFVFKSWTKDSQIVFEKNPSYWIAGAPKLDRVVFQILPETAVVVQGLLSGAIDFYDGIDKGFLAQLTASKDIRIEPQLSSIVNVISINGSRPAFKDVRVRQALNYAIDKKKVLDLAYDGGKEVGTFDDPNDPYYVDFTKNYPYDPAKAKDLLTQAGYDFSQTLDLVLPQLYDAHVKAGQIYQQYLEAVGVHTKIRLVEWATWISSVYKGGDFDLTVIGHTGKLDPDGRLRGYGTLGPYVKWENKQVADWIAQAAQVVKFEDRKKIYDQVLATFSKEAPFVFVGVPVVNAVFRSNVTGFVKTPKLDTYDFRWTVKN